MSKETKGLLMLGLIFGAGWWVGKNRPLRKVG